MADEQIEQDTAPAAPVLGPNDILFDDRPIEEIEADEQKPEPEKKPEKGEEGEDEAEGEAKKPGADDPDADGKDDADVADEPDGDEPDGEKSEADAWSEIPEGVRKRVARASRRARDATERARAADETISQLESRIAALESGDGSDEEEKPPRIDDYEDYEDFVKAEDAYKQKKTTKEKEPEPERKAEPQIIEGFTQALSELQEAIEVKDIDLWDDVSKADIIISQTLVMTLSESKAPDVVLRALMENPDEAKRISGLNARAQALAVMKMEGEKPEGDPKQTRIKRRKSRVEPIDDGKTRGGLAQKPLEKMTFSEYADVVNKADTESDGWL